MDTREMAWALRDLRAVQIDDGEADDATDLRPLLAASIRLAQRGPDAMRDAHELRRRMRRAGLRIVTGGRDG